MSKEPSSAAERQKDVYKRQGDKVDHLADELFAYGADSVYLLEDELLAQYTTDGYTKVITLSLIHI